jgi:hypothetical protein
MAYDWNFDKAPPALAHKKVLDLLVYVPQLPNPGNKYIHQNKT